jgi:hypothetical protein
LVPTSSSSILRAANWQDFERARKVLLECLLGETLDPIRCFADLSALLGAEAPGHERIPPRRKLRYLVAAQISKMRFIVKYTARFVLLEGPAM